MSIESKIWNQYGDTFRPGSTASNVEILPPGIYGYGQDMSGYFLTKKSDSYQFPYKIYGNNDAIVSRVSAAWKYIDANLGILLNGIKGTGKTVTAQLIANWAISTHRMPVIVVSHPIANIGEILARMKQNVMVIFDEFEKTHAQKEDQHALLTALDGMSRNEFKRLFVFTTNDKQIDPNLVDRPSRIRYSWEFNRLSESVMNDLMDDILHPELNSLRPSIVQYLNSRHVLSIDVVKTVLTEVNIFREDPHVFEPFMNLTEQIPLAFRIEMLDMNRSIIKTITTSFMPQNKNERKKLQGFLSKAGAEIFKEAYSLDNPYQIQDSFSHYVLRLLAPTEDPMEWVCNIGIPIRDTWWDKYKKLASNIYGNMLWLDVKPSDWSIPDYIVKYENEKDPDEDLVDTVETFTDSSTVYGTGTWAKILVRITPEFSTYQSVQAQLAY